MPEFFELTFFEKKGETNPLLIIKNISQIFDDVFDTNIYDINSEKTVFEFFEKEKLNEYMVSIPDLVFNESNIKCILYELTRCVDKCLYTTKSLIFASGIYELTNYYMNDIKDIKDIDNELLQKFPVLFFRKGECEQFSQCCYCGNAVCCLNTKAQCLY